MRTPSQSTKAIAQDLQHFVTAFDRASSNETRSAAVNKRVLSSLRELIEIFQAEKLGAATSGRRPARAERERSEARS